jgi:hypothetical protein
VVDLLRQEGDASANEDADHGSRAHAALTSWKRLRPPRLLTTAALIAIATFLLRFVGRGSTFDVFVDEFVYEGLGRSVRDGGWPHFGPDLFFLHPPGFFYLEGLWEDLTVHSRSTNPLALVDAARGLNSLLAGVSAGLLAWIVGRRSLPWGIVAGLLFALDPYVQRQNGRALLETATMTWALLGFALLLPMLTSPARHRRSLDRHRRRRAIAGGLALGLAILTKDEAVMVTLVPLCAGALLWRRRRVDWLPVAMIATVVPYTLYVVIVTVTGHLPLWFHTKVSGILRISGAQVTTGFSAAGAPSLWERIGAQIVTYGPSYALLGLGCVSAAILLRGRHKEDASTVLALVFGGGAVLVGYSLKFGTVEEQVLYLLLVPSVVACCTWGSMLTERTGRNATVLPGRFSPVAICVCLLLGGVVTTNVVTFVKWHVHSDNGYARVREYLASHASIGTGVIIVNGTSEFALDDLYKVGPYTSTAERARYHIRYLVVPWREVNEGYTYVTLPTIRSLTKHAKLVLDFPERTYGRVSLYRLQPPHRAVQRAP